MSILGEVGNTMDVLQLPDPDGPNLFNTLPDELVLKIIEMAATPMGLAWPREDNRNSNFALRTLKFNFLVKVVSKISNRYVAI